MRPHRTLLFAAAALALLASPSARAVAPAAANAGQIPDFTVWDEAGQQTTLARALAAAGSGPVIVLPIYARCTMSCPITTNMLVGEAAKMTTRQPYRVVIFSFDPTDDATALRHFRADKHVPPAWLILRSNSEGIRRFCDFFHFPVMTEGPVMIHNNQFFLLDHTLVWRATFIDKDWNAAQLQTWLNRVENPTLLGWLAMNPTKLATLGFAGLLLSLAAILTVFLTRPTP